MKRGSVAQGDFARADRRHAPRGFFVTGTDTGVGKTRAACALLHALARTGIRAVGMKPIAAGATRDAQGLLNEDVAALTAASAIAAPRALMNPYCFEPAIAPHIAAAQAGVVIDLEVIARAFEALADLADAVVVEGAGGFCVPLGSRLDGGDLAERLGLPVILVVGLRLGCLNHALLTAQAVRARGLVLAGWIANRIDPAMAAVAKNVAALAQRLGAPLLAEFEFAPATPAGQFADGIDLTRIDIVQRR
jgi:dethiobiotin synthetase